MTIYGMRIENANGAASFYEDDTNIVQNAGGTAVELKLHGLIFSRTQIVSNKVAKMLWLAQI